jgi:hypothetical protein
MCVTWVQSPKCFSASSTNSISRQAVTAREEGSFELGVLLGLPPLSLVDMLQMTLGSKDS